MLAIELFEENVYRFVIQLTPTCTYLVPSLPVLDLTNLLSSIPQNDGFIQVTNIQALNIVKHVFNI